MLLCSCSKEPVVQTGPDGDRIVFGSAYATKDAQATKAEAVTSLSSFYASATTGAAGSEAAVWTSATFTKDGATDDYKGDKWWPSSNPSYHFYASNSAITFAAGGSTVAATDATDVVCAYMASPAYKTKNTLVFEHIFARLGTVTVSADSGYTINNISITITPYTGGTYNIRTGAGNTDGTGWSNLASGSITGIANPSVDAGNAKSNNIYLVPGTYTLTVSWRATKGLYSETFTNKTATVFLEAGKVNALTTTLGGNAKEPAFTVTVTPWEHETDDIEMPTA